MEVYSPSQVVESIEYSFPQIRLTKDWSADIPCNYASAVSHILKAIDGLPQQALAFRPVR